MTDHARQLLEKHFKKPFLNLSYAGGLERMDEATVREGIAWLDDCFHIIRHQDDVMPSVEWILDLARAAVLRYFLKCALSFPCRTSVAIVCFDRLGDTLGLAEGLCASE